MSATFVAKLTPEQGRTLYTELGHGSYQFRRVDHAWWAAQGNDVSVVFYRSGKLVAQGKGVDVFIERHRSILGAAVSEPAHGTQGRAQARETFVAHATCPTAGSDESGKGDYFGPLAVAAVLVRPDQAELLKRLDIVDSKLAGDARIRQSEGLLLRDLVCAVRVLEPEAYNAAWEAVRNVNVLLGRLHAEVLGEVLGKAKDPAACRIVVDKFGDPSHVTKHLAPHAKKAAFSMITGGEREPAVAAASFLARAAFLRGFDALRNDAGTDLPLGASDPRIVPCARALLREGGMPWLRKFAKLHFKTTQRAGA